jgi:hypothetical protein
VGSRYSRLGQKDLAKNCFSLIGDVNVELAPGMTRHVIDPGGKTSRISYLSCDDEATFTIVAGGIEQKDAAVKLQWPNETSEGSDDEAMMPNARWV